MVEDWHANCVAIKASGGPESKVDNLTEADSLLVLIKTNATKRIARSTLQTRKLWWVGWWMSEPTIPRVTFDLPECKEIFLKNENEKKRKFKKRENLKR